MRLSSKIKWKFVILSHVQLLYCKIVQHLNHPKFTCNKRMQEKPVTQRKMKRRLKAIPRERYGTNIWASNIKSSATTLQSIHQYLGFKVAQTMLEPNPLVTRFNQSISKWESFFFFFNLTVRESTISPRPTVNTFKHCTRG